MLSTDEYCLLQEQIFSMLSYAAKLCALCSGTVVLRLLGNKTTGVGVNTVLSS